ncbi:single-stranded-DNA-specific exonuclease RecJ [Methylocella sp. CPCC 101449]|jgi:single-stranded-DNA-specific exonuclease|uniref:single-stranded-DNA-specific exonuclease RecJ n=1 Tax=Methylocella sp. CPCC 101449 TaxID=2987531 RepID=UPI0028923925|nr:single-stranded-DNA-specific exonuclease RecJ [Methylocella sp. CPCC 101449]MDT2021903.1 single-stranded-DNA-specific exonuclease RecJ [Methylocella sp. CPCC 101449]HEV2571993.1 single-stranded-DNA-specific exonuclease RecJ [Beijerinckiaceae bacterium]
MLDTAVRPAFLNVERSVTGVPWRDRLGPDGRAISEALVQQFGISDILARVLAGRGVTPETALPFLHPTVRDAMPDPATMVDMEPAIARLAQAITAGERIAIFGDYDVDGACSSALLADFLRHCGSDHAVHIPDRIFEGYGPNNDAISRLAADGATLLVTVDCGTASIEPFEHARTLGLDVIVLDHHQAPEVLPSASAIVNPNRLDDLSGLGYLCAAGVVFMTLVALNRRLREQGFWRESRPAPDLLKSLDLVALATVADVVPLRGLNRAFVSTGLQVIRGRGRIGLRALFDAAGLDGPPQAFSLGFMIGPRINAGGRIGDASLGARLLSLDDEAEAVRIAAELDRLNKERQVLEMAAVAEAEAEALASLGLDEEGAAVVVAASQGWHPGIVGLVAARLKERFGRPAFAIAMGGLTGTGSGRSIPGVDLGKAVRAAVEAHILVKGGGHAMAAGVTVERDKLGAFRAWLEERLGETVARARAEHALIIDAALTAGGARKEMVADVERAGPFGSGNPEPVFALPSLRILDASQVGTQHVRVRAQSGDSARIDAVAFRALEKPLGQALIRHRGEILHLAGTLSIDRWGGNERVRLRIIDAAVPD